MEHDASHRGREGHKDALAQRGRDYNLDGRVLEVSCRLNVTNINYFINGFAPKNALAMDPQGINMKAMGYIRTY